MAEGNTSHVQTARNRSIDQTACTGTLRILICRPEAEGGRYLPEWSGGAGLCDGREKKGAEACLEPSNSGLFGLEISRPRPNKHHVPCIMCAAVPKRLVVWMRISQSSPP